MKYSHWVLLLILLLVAAFTLSPAAALKVEGAKIMLDVKPGTTYIFPMAVSIQPDDAATELHHRYPGLRPDARCRHL